MKDLPILKDFINVKVKMFHLNMTLIVSKMFSRVEYQNQRFDLNKYGTAACNRSASCQIRSLGMNGTLNMRGSVTVVVSL